MVRRWEVDGTEKESGLKHECRMQRAGDFVQRESSCSYLSCITVIRYASTQSSPRTVLSLQGTSNLHNIPFHYATFVWK